MSAVTIVDYGLGNLHSVINAFSSLGAEIRIAESGAALDGADRIVLPGVGAFGDGMAGLRERGHAEALVRHAAQGRPLIGICLGAQLLMSTSEEFGTHDGLGIISGAVRQIPAEGVKVPLVGWRRLSEPADGRWGGSLLDSRERGAWMYFVHSFHCEPESPSDLLAVAMHGPHPIHAAVRHGAVTGFQFHPEKSGAAGMNILKNFLEFKS
ncbi:MAG: imidazole glycerol phosphate synthase subunit HisH [Chthoniobacterales bacterium]